MAHFLDDLALLGLGWVEASPPSRWASKSKEKWIFSMARFCNWSALNQSSHRSLPGGFLQAKLLITLLISCC